MPRTKKPRQQRAPGEETTARVRILDAAFDAFMANGYAATSTLEIATRARVSKRELYAVVGNKEQMLIACISNRARRFQVPAELPAPQDRESLAELLSVFGAQLLREISDPGVVGMFRLAIAEATRAPEVARALRSFGGEAVDVALRQVMTAAGNSGLLEGDPGELTEQFWGLLWGRLQVGLLLGVTARPESDWMAERARRAATVFLQLHPLPRP